MKVQIAIIAGGLAIAAGVAYAELKPSKTSNVNVNSAATASPTSVAPQNTAPHIPQNSQSAPSKKLSNPNSASHIQPPNGGGEGEGENRGRSEHEGGIFGFNGEGDD